MAKRKAAKKKTTKAEAETGRANWGAAENPRHCRSCPSVNSTVQNTVRFTHPDRVVRYRLCLDCRQRFSTIEICKPATV